MDDIGLGFCLSGENLLAKRIFYVNVSLLPVEPNAMTTLLYAIGQAVFIRTDTPDYAEATIPFTSLEEMVIICSQPRPNLTLEKVVVYGMTGTEPIALTLGFISASQGQRPANSTAV